MTPMIRELHDGVALWRLNMPDQRNPLSPAMKAAFTEGIAGFSTDPAQRVLVITGQDEVFCAGGDLRSIDSTPGTVATRQRMAESHAFIRAMAAVEKPVVMAVNGAAVGAGASLAMLGDVIVASDRGWFASGFPKVGVLPDLGLLYTLPRIIGMARAKDFVLTLRRYDAAEALAIGMVSRVFAHDTLLEDTMKMAAGMARGPGVSLGLSKRLMNLGMADTFDSYLVREELGQAVVFGTEDFREGARAFRDKRPPEFSGR